MWTKEWCPGYKPVSPSSILTEELGLYFIRKRGKKANESKKTQIELLIKDILIPSELHSKAMYGMNS